MFCVLCTKCQFWNFWEERLGFIELKEEIIFNKEIYSIDFINTLNI